MAGEQRRIAELEAENAELRAENEVLAAKLAELEAKLGRSSKNSSAPPSSDDPGKAAEVRKSRAERRRSAREAAKAAMRRRGKQPGAKGKNLPMRDDPDEIVVHEAQCCGSCGRDLTGADAEGYEARQVFDIPEPKLHCTEHRAIKRRCSCGRLSTAAFPAEARSPATYGNNIRAVVLYLLHAQHLSVERTAEACSEMLGVEVSTGFVSPLAAEAAGLLSASGFLEALVAALIQAEVIHLDETTDQVRTKTWWFHVVATEAYTYLFASPTRAKAAPDQAGVLPRYRGTMVHDRLAMYFHKDYARARHQICLAHVIRELDSIAEVESQKAWADGMKKLLSDTIAACHKAAEQGRRRLPPGQLESFLARYDAFVEAGLQANPDPPPGLKRSYLQTKSYNMAAALRDLRAEATLFTRDLMVPPTNNEAERSLRMLKLHKKVSGCFQSEEHARHFAAIRSYIGTARKCGIGALDALGRLFRNDVWMPPATT